MLNDRFYSGARKYDYERSLARHKDLLTDEEIGLMRRYIDEKQAIKHISEARARKIGFTLVGWRRFIAVPWNKLQLKDVYAGITAMKNGKSEKGKPFKPHTLRDYIEILKPFVEWMNEEGIVSMPVKKVREIKNPFVDPQTVMATDLLTAEDVQALIKAALTDRDRAMISTLYESGIRIGELGRLTWRDLKFDEYGVKLYIDDRKTSKRRYSRLTMSTEYLASLKNHYNGKLADDAFVFLSEKGLPMTYIGCIRVLERAAKNAGVKKNVRHAHLFRHSRATHLIQQNFQESVIKKSLWGNVDTKQFKVYVSLGEQDIDTEFLKRAGIKTPETEKKDALKPRPCGRCHTINAPTSNFCSKCGLPLTEDAIATLQEAEKAAELLPEYKAILETVIAQLETMQAQKAGNR